MSEIRIERGCGSDRLVWGRLWAAVVITAASAGAWAAPIPSGPDAQTGLAARELLFAYEWTQTVEAYKEVGKKSPEWDEKAVRFLSESQMAWSERGDVMSWAELEQLGRELVETLSCDDPLVLYAHAEALIRQNRAYEVVETLGRAASGLMTQGYSPRLAGLALSHLGTYYERNSRQAEMRRVDDAARAAWRALMDDPILLAEPRLQQRVFDRGLRTRDDGEMYRSVYEDAKVHGGIDPWVVTMFGVESEMDLAWDARGGGFASTVTPQGWAGFERHLTTARELALEAYEAHPERPEAATALIRITMGGHGPERTTTRTWFDRAVKAEFDYLPAYGAYINAIMPRWGGTPAQMFLFARECLATKRFDTPVPWQYFAVFRSMVADTGSHAGLLHAPGVYDQFAQLMTGYRNGNLMGRSRAWYDCLLAAAAFHAEKYDEAQAILDTMTYPEWRADAFKAFDLDMNTAAMLTAGRAHNGGELAKELDRLMKAGEYEQTVDLCFQEAEPLAENPGDQLHKYLMHRAWVGERMMLLEEGEEVDIMPGPYLAGWLIQSGNWWVDEPTGTVIGASWPTGLTMTFDLPIEDDFEVAGTFVSFSVYSNVSHAEVAFQVGPGRFRHGVVFDLAGRRVAVAESQVGNTIERPATLKQEGYDFRVRFSGGKVWAWVDGQLIIDGVDQPDPVWNVPTQFGIGGSYWFEGGTVKFANLTIKRS